jgi:subtilase family serine protease
VLAAGALALVLASSAGGTTASRATLASVRATPLVTGHVLKATLSFPPTTDFCLNYYGIHCYNPNQYEKAYNLDPLWSSGFKGAGRTIVIVDSFGSPTIANDLHVFDQTYGLPDPPSLKTIEPAGAVPPFDATNADMVGWAQETTLDVEYAHAMAPEANILIAATPVAETEGVEGFPEIVKAENYVIDHKLGDVITQSFGATENTFPTKKSLLDLRSAYKNAVRNNVTVLGSSGDSGSTDYTVSGDLYTFPVNSWPSSDPLVTSIGGTQLTLDNAGNRLSPDVVWNDGYGAGGGGLSQVFERPDFQNKVQSVVGDVRGTPDISLSAAVDGGCIVYYTFQPGHEGYHIFGGTSEASPLFAGVVALADQVAKHRLGYLNPLLYGRSVARSAGVVDVTSGNNDIGAFMNSDGIIYHVPGYNAGPGYDLASGLGTVDVSAFVKALVGADRSAHN